MTQEEKAKAYDEALERARNLHKDAIDTANNLSAKQCEIIFPELKESKDEKIRKNCIHFLDLQKSHHASTIEIDECIDWLEKQGDIDKISYDIAEKEKNDFVSGQFIECRKSFKKFKEDNSYWLEYIGNDTYIGRSDNILNEKLHITPRQLFTLFTQEHCPKEDNTNDETNAPTEYGKYVDEYLGYAAEHFFSEGEDKYSVADLFYAGVRCGRSWLEKQGEQNPANKVEPKFKVGDWVVGEISIYKIISLNDELNCYMAINLNNEKVKIPYYFDDGPGHMCSYHLWTIEDIKDGDILVYRNTATEIIMIFKSWSVNRKAAHTYFHIFDYDNYRINDSCDCGNGVHPATKEERDTIFAKMKEVGYDWDNKKLKKIEENSFESDIVEKAICKAGYEWSEDTHQLMKIKPKFKVGDWVVFNNNHESIYQIEKIENFQYTLRHILGGSAPLSFASEYMIRLWTIKDAKPGDVLCGFPYTDCPWIGIFHKLNDDHTFNSYCYLQAGINGKFCPPSEINIFGKRNVNDHSSKSIVPATKEQRDLLFQKMHEAEYEWDANKKELKKIITETKFKVGDWIISSVLGTAHIIGVNDYDEYQLEYIDGYRTFSSIDYVNYEYDKWTIQNAKDGDVLAFDNDTIVIFKDLYNASSFHSYCHIEDGVFNISRDDTPDWWNANGFYPATKEQCDFFFTEMKEWGYEWDAKNKEIK